jgi:hypothetical protein
MHSLEQPYTDVLCRNRRNCQSSTSLPHLRGSYSVLRHIGGHLVYHLSIIWLHECVSQHSFDETFVSSGMAPRL